MATVKEVITALQADPEICGLEQIVIDNVWSQPANVLDLRNENNHCMMLISNNAHDTDQMDVITFIALISYTVKVMGRTMEVQVFADDIINYPRPQKIDPKIVDGVVYLRFVEP